jgi:hypothetical protein
MQAEHDEKWEYVYGCVAKEFDVVIARYRDDASVIQWRIDVATECQTSTHNARESVQKFGGMFGSIMEVGISWKREVSNDKKIGVIDLKKSLSGLDVRKNGSRAPREQMTRHRSSVEVRKAGAGQFQALDPKNPFA